MAPTKRSYVERDHVKRKKLTQDRNPTVDKWSCRLTEHHRHVELSSHHQAHDKNETKTMIDWSYRHSTSSILMPFEALINQKRQATKTNRRTWRRFISHGLRKHSAHWQSMPITGKTQFPLDGEKWFAKKVELWIFHWVLSESESTVNDLLPCSVHLWRQETIGKRLTN
jgi:hypothetical protein